MGQEIGEAEAVSQVNSLVCPSSVRASSCFLLSAWEGTWARQGLLKQQLGTSCFRDVGPFAAVLHTLRRTKDNSYRRVFSFSDLFFFGSPVS